MVWFGLVSLLNGLSTFMGCLFVVTHLKSAQDRLISDVLGVLKSFRSSKIILALQSDPTETIIPAGDPAVKSLPSTQNRIAHTSKKNITMPLLMSF